MNADEHGRDIGDSLTAILILFKKLDSVIPMPQIFDLFKEGKDTYLVMEFISGTSLHKWI